MCPVHFPTSPNPMKVRVYYSNTVQHNFEKCTERHNDKAIKHPDVQSAFQTAFACKMDVEKKEKKKLKGGGKDHNLNFLHSKTQSVSDFIVPFPLVYVVESNTV